MGTVPIPPGVTAAPEQTTVAVPEGVAEETDQSPAAVAARHARSREGHPAAEALAAQVEGMTPNEREAADQPGLLESLATGVGKEALKTVRGGENLVNKVLPSGAQLPVVAEHENLNTEGGAEGVGGAVEQGVEFAAGGEALKGAAALLKVAKYYPEALKIAEKFPKTAKLLLGLGKGAAVGGAQGAVKGAAEGDTARQAEAGAVGGGLGEASAEALALAAKPVARILGLGGLSSEEAMTKAGRPYISEINFADSVKKAMPRLIALNKVSKFKNLQGFIERLGDAQSDLWTKEVEPGIQAADKEMLKKGELFDGTAIAKAVRKAKTPSMVAMPGIFKGDLADIERVASDFDNFQYKLSEANEFLKTLNAKLNEFYRMDPVTRHAASVTDGALRAMETAADELRGQIYAKVDAVTGALPGTHADLRAQYGALKDLARVFGKRATVEERQAPMSLPMVFGLMKAGEGLIDLANLQVGSGLKKIFIGALPAGAKAKQAGGSLLRQGIKAAEREAAGPGAGAAVGEAVKTEAGALGAQGARAALPPKDPAHVRFKASDGSVHDVPVDQLDAAKKIDPDLELIE